MASSSGAMKLWADQYPKRSQRFLVVGFNLLVAFWVLNSLFASHGLSASKVGISLLLLASVGCFALQILSNGKKPKFDPVSRLLMGLLFFWGSITIFRGLTTDTARLFTLIANPDIGGLVWLLPFAAFMGRNPRAFLRLMPTFRWHAALGSCFVLWTIYAVSTGGMSHRDSAANVGLILMYAAPFVLLTGIGSRWDTRICTAAMLLAALGHLVLSNRAGFAIAIWVVVVFLVLGRVSAVRQAATRLAALTVIVLAFAIFGLDYLFTTLSDQWLADTRTFLWMELNDDFSWSDWLIGRGALGQYYSPFFARLSAAGGEGDWMYRQVNEIGYLHLALKTGLLGVGLYLMVMLRALVKSLRVQNRRFAVGLMLLLFLHIAELSVIGQATFQPARVLLWMLVGMALTTPAKKFNQQDL